MPVNPDNVVCNVADQQADADSVLAFWRTAVSVRRANKVLTYGLFELHDLKPQTGDSIFAYTRTLDDQRAAFVGNFDSAAHAVDLAELGVSERTRVLLQTGTSTDFSSLGPFEARLYLL